MTYCVAMRLESGMVFVADSRTNAGVYHIATFRKVHIFSFPDERLIILMSSGNLATTQSVVSLLRMRAHTDQPNLFGCDSLFDAAEIVGRTVREVIDRDKGTQQKQVDFGCNMIIGGQVKGEDMRLFHVYPEGNFIEASEDTPYVQIGEIKYGKPIIDRVVSFNTPLDQAAKCALISMDSTIRSNLSVGMPLDLVLYRKDQFGSCEQYDVQEQHKGYQRLRDAWSRGLRKTFEKLPDLEL